MEQTSGILEAAQHKGTTSHPSSAGSHSTWAFLETHPKAIVGSPHRTLPSRLPQSLAPELLSADCWDAPTRSLHSSTPQTQKGGALACFYSFFFLIL